MIRPIRLSRRNRNPIYSISGLKCKQMELIGSGTYGDVYRAKTYDYHIKEVALKLLDNKQLALSEYQIHSFLFKKDRHGHIPEMFGIEKLADGVILAMEYLPNGTLHEKSVTGRGLPQKQIQLFFRELMNGIEFIHKNDIVHRDIKPMNLLISSSNTLKIADFGSSCRFRYQEEELDVTGAMGTAKYWAPEVFTSLRVKGPPLDIWAAGIVLLTMLTKSDQFWSRAVSDDEEYTRWQDQTGNNHDKWKNLNGDCLDLLRQMLCHDPTERSTVQMIQSHPWYTRNI